MSILIIGPRAASVDNNTSRMIAAIDSMPISEPSAFQSAWKLSLHKTTRTIKPTYHPPSRGVPIREIRTKLIRLISGHLGCVRSAPHPTLDVLITASHDVPVRVWDICTKVHVLSSHMATAAVVKCQESEPQVITGSMDFTVQLWDLTTDKTNPELTTILTADNVSLSF
ncbi:Prp46 protein [Mycena venus]|uniref:Pre-mRNA-splicing factor PRP46 n=1 Tax=Mycena venus TaxID=2733690 RepID=A0A8H6YYT6_9AGAR|nr:Prp46 protein [Mycena venus]